MMKSIFYSFIFILLSSTLSAQILTRQSNESPSAFIERCFSFSVEEITEIHPVIEAVWGATKQKKILFFKPSEADYSTLEGIVLEPFGKSNQYIVIRLGILDNIGIYQTSITSVFFEDENKDGFKDLFILLKGEIRVSAELEEEDENGNIIIHKTTACCDDIYSTSVYTQDKNTLGFDYSNLEIEGVNMEELEDASMVRKALKTSQ